MLEHATRCADSRTRRIPSGLTIPTPDRLYFVSATILDVSPIFPAHSFLDSARYTHILFVPNAIVSRERLRYRIRTSASFSRAEALTDSSLTYTRPLALSPFPQSCSPLVCIVLRVCLHSLTVSIAVADYVLVFRPRRLFAGT